MNSQPIALNMTSRTLPLTNLYLTNVTMPSSELHPIFISQLIS